MMAFKNKEKQHNKNITKSKIYKLKVNVNFIHFLFG